MRQTVHCEGFLAMNLAAKYYELVNWPGKSTLIMIFAVGLVLLVTAGTALALGKVRWFARGLGIVGLVLIVLVLFIVPQQTISLGWLYGIELTRPRYSRVIRVWSLAGLVGVPAMAGAVMLSVLMSTQRRLRAVAPRYVKAGRKEFIGQNYAASLRAYNKAIELAPIVGDTYCQRGLVHRAMGNTEQALADFERAISLDPRLSAAYLSRARIRTDQGALDQALDDLNHVMALRGNDPEVYLHRGACLLKKGLYNDARADLQRVLKLTNHSDFADPAKSALRDLEARTRPFAAPAGSNGSGATVAPQEPKPQDHFL
jgi:tetratricopeptide (TPR) repeat protein